MKNYRQKSRETLREYIRRFFRQCNELPNVADADIIGAFLSGTTCESLVHKLGCKGPWTTKELLDIMTSHASDEEAVGPIFDRSRGKVKRDEDADEGPSDHLNKKKNWKGRGSSLVAAVERKVGRAPVEGTPDHFDKSLEGPCPNHTFPIKHMYKDCSLMKRFFTGGSKKWEQKKKPKAEADDTEEKDSDFLSPDCYLMIFSGPESYGSKR